MSRPTPARPREDTEKEKHAAAAAAAELVEPGMRVGLGTGSTVAHFLPLLARRRLDVVCVATSPGTSDAAERLGLDVRPFEDEGLDHLEIAVDGADQVAPDFWLIKGGGGAHTREKVVAMAADRFVVIVSSDKLVERLSAPVPLELLTFGARATLRALPGAVLRSSSPRTPDGGLVADWYGALDDPAKLSARLNAVPGLVDHGLFPPELVSEVIVGRPDGPDRLVRRVS